MTRPDSHLAALITGLLLFACPAVKVPLERPGVRVPSLSVRATPDSALSVRLELAVFNPNSRALTVRVLDWELEIGEAGPIRGRSDCVEVVSARGETRVELVFLVPASTAAELSSAMRSGARSYSLRGTLHLDGPGGGVGAIVDESGDIGPD